MNFKPIGLFLSSADEIFGPIATLQRENCIVKHLPWSAFKLADNDWQRVVDVRDILGVCEIPCLFIWNKANAYIYVYRILIKSSNTFLRKNSQHFGVPFLPSKNCNQLGKRNGTHLLMNFIKMLLPMGSIS